MSLLTHIAAIYVLSGMTVVFVLTTKQKTTGIPRGGYHLLGAYIGALLMSLVILPLIIFGFIRGARGKG